jgi:Ni,Fe-hydrogenase III small subunit
MTLLDRIIALGRQRSPWVYRLNAGSCNGCDIEVGPCMAPRYDAEQLGIEFHGAPKHCDILLISGTLTARARAAVLDVYAQMASPKAVVALGSCPASGNVFAESPLVLGEPLDAIIPVDVWVQGCPPRPQMILDGVAKAARLLAEGRTQDQLQSAAPSALPAGRAAEAGRPA